MSAPPAYAVNGPKRNGNTITVYLSPKQPPPMSIPFELQGMITADEWASRIPALRAITSRFVKPMLERIWIFLSFIAFLIVPMVVYHFLISGVNLDVEPGADQRAELDAFAKARGISAAVLAGVVLVSIVPLLLWKFIGQRSVNLLLRRWATKDRFNKSEHACPTWAMSMPFLKDNAIVSITLPPTALPSAFHPDAYLPSYINGPLDPNATYFYPYNKSEPGLPRMSTVGSLPLYGTDEKRGWTGFEESKV